MGKPKKRTSHRATGARRSHLVLELARAVNRRSPVKVRTTKRENPRSISRDAIAIENSDKKPDTVIDKIAA